MPDLKFGTSGLRGLVTDLTDEVCRHYMTAFLVHMARTHGLKAGSLVLIGRDLRASSPRMARAVMRAAQAAGHRVENCGALPTPALALAARTRRLCAVMVTGSHIPDERNGLKFYRTDGEIDKADEAGIMRHLAKTAPPDGNTPTPRASPGARLAYTKRALSILPGRALAGMRIGVYQHSSVARDMLADILGRLGADVAAVERADCFIAVDTEALQDRDRKIAARAVRTHRLDALVSTDGDGDRPLVADENGIFLRGDVVGLLCAYFLGGDAVATPVTSTSMIETCCFFKRVYRCRVGSPYVIEAMRAAKSDGFKTVVGFEANGGVLLGSDTAVAGKILPALPTRDAILPILALLGLARQRSLPVSALRTMLPERYTASERLENIPPETSMAFMERLADAGERGCFFRPLGTITGYDVIDGLRVTFSNGDTIHFRASGNAPELRCYAEASNQQAADAIVKWGLSRAFALVGP